MSRRVLAAAGLAGCGCVAVLALLAVALLVPASAPPAAGPEPRTVLVVAVDDLRRDHLAFHGYRLDPAPRLGALAARGAAARDFVPASTSSAASVASLLCGAPPWVHGLASAREIGATRIAGSARTLAETLEGFDAAGAVATRALLGRVSGLDAGFDAWVGGGGPAGEPLAAREVLAALEPELEPLLARGRDALVFVHLADLAGRGSAGLGAGAAGEAGAPAGDLALLEAHLAPFRAAEPAVGPALARARDDLAGALADLERAVGRRRSSPEWRALQHALYDLRLARVDRALGALLDRLGRAGRRDLLVVVAGTRGALLAEEPPAGPPRALVEPLLETALVAARLRPEEADWDGAAWTAVGGSADVLDAILRELRPSEEGEPDPPRPMPRARLVAGASLLALAAVEADRKAILAAGRAEGPFPVFGRGPRADLALGEAAAAPVRPPELPVWRVAIAPPDGERIEVVVESPGGDLVRVEGAPGPDDGRGPFGEPPQVSPKGTSARASFGAPGELAVACARRTAPLVLRADTLGGGVAALVRGGGDARLLPVLPARPAEDAAALVRVTLEGGWARVRAGLDAPGAEVALSLWAVPPEPFGAALEIELEDQAGGAPPQSPAADALAGLGGARVSGVAPLALRVRLGPGRRLAVAARIAGEPVPARAIAADDGGAPDALALYLPPSPAGLLALPPGSPPDVAVAYDGPPLPMLHLLTDEDVRVLRRLDPLE